ncbi:histone acetyltransferase spt10 [Pyrenophora seminiperda CCB06]|uniref:Histone acetyltransferase spt10 n=1 Tax=Pyrenophora seminiperda CCB06 TaxID=1302712 RepID=A0A3M7M7N4_9PLEO|nr:histone acetyltransferase spt10 [Pyrenophora seminiperda CCB06]
MGHHEPSTMANFSKPASLLTVLFTLFALLQFTVAFQHGAHHAHPARSDAELQEHLDKINGELTKRQSQGTIAIAGVCSAGVNSNGQCNSGSTASPRLEVREMARNSDQFNLFLLGMERFQAKDKSDPLSYYQIAGVHGHPFVSWNRFPTPLVNQAGFCPHATTLFAPWHRPYLAVFEQALFLSVNEVISQFPANQQQRWRNAASTLRLPYWDWASTGNGPAVPTMLRDQTVGVMKPQGPVAIPNPLYKYSWGTYPAEMGNSGPWNNFPDTLRRPVANPTRSNNNEMNARFEAMRLSLRDRVFALFASKAPWGDVTSAAIGARTAVSGGGVDSFESIHDAIHNAAGGESGGHMYYLDQSAFDPIFWLHHANVDRLADMYHYITPNTWMANGNVMHPMAQWNQGEPKNAYSPLKPFTKDQSGTYFTAMDIKDTRTLGYYYPETSDRSYQQVAQAVTRQYGAGVRSITKRDDSVGPTGQYQGRPIKEGDYHTVLAVIADKYAISGSYTVHCFIGKPDNNSTTNSTAPYPIANSTASATSPLSTGTSPYSNNTEADYDPSTDYTQYSNYVGSYGILGSSMKGGSNSSQPVMTKGSLPLTSCLQGKEAKGELESLRPEHVEPYLKENLYYKVVGVNGEIDPDTLPNFHISVMCNPAKPAASPDELPDLSAPLQVLPDATAHLPAGKPFTYVPSALDIPLPDTPEYTEPSSDGTRPQSPSNGVFPYPSMPWEESGYCVSKQTVEYVDPQGNFLYSSIPIALARPPAMPAMLDDPSAPVIYRTSGDVPYPPPGGPLPVGIAPCQVILRDRVTTATIIPFSAPNQVPLTLLAYLCDQLGREIEKGDTYPMVEPLALNDFGPYWFGVFGAIMLLGEIQDGRALYEMARQGCDWERECLGSFCIKPNYPGRSSHVCNGAFLVTDASRNRGVGRLMGETYLDWAPKLGYTYSVFNLVYETNIASCRIWDALGFKRIGRVKGCGNLKSYPGELVDAIIYGRDLGQDDEFVSEERFDKIRFYLKNGKYPNGADRAEKSRLRSAATHYKLTPGKDDEADKLWLKGKEVIADPKQQYELAREIHHKQHGGINKTTAAIAETYHWVRIKETVSQVIRNCPVCSEMNKGLSAIRQGQNQARAEGRSSSGFMQSTNNTQSPLTPTPPSLFSPSLPPPRSDSPSSQLQLEAAQHRGSFAQFSPHNRYDMPVDPALMEGVQAGNSLADLPPSPFLAAQGANGLPHLGHVEQRVDPSLNERAATAAEEMRRRLSRTNQYN